MDKRKEEYWWLIGAVWLFGIVLLVIVLNVVRVHLTRRFGGQTAQTQVAPAPVAPSAPGAGSQSIFSESAETNSTTQEVKPA